MSKLHDVPKDPAELLLRVRKNNPRASEKEIRDTVLDNFTKAHFVAVFDYWFGNLWPRLNTKATKSGGTTTTYRPGQKPHTRPGARTAAQRRRAEAAERFKAVLLLDLTLSTGKALRDSTFADCEREGGWLASIATAGKKKHGANAKVGKHMTETDLQNIRLRNSPPSLRLVTVSGRRSAA